jgi:hypothetical protein
VSTGSPSGATVAVPDKAVRGMPPGAASMTQALTALASLAPYSIAYIQNNLPYAQRLEDGWSKQAPAGMVALSLAELQAEIVGGLTG